MVTVPSAGIARTAKTAAQLIMTTPNASKKQAVIARLYADCQAAGNLTFDNDAVRRVAAAVDFKNPFDATKIDHSALLPAALVDDDAFIVHLGQGRHRFVHGISAGYHRFEPIPAERRHRWPYRRSILNNINTSESNILSVGYNQRIIHDFLYEDIAASPKVYGSNRTQIPLDYRIGSDRITATRVQVEIDFTLEYLGMITVFEAKNGAPDDFNVFQLFNPYRYYRQITEGQPGIVINCCYLLRQGDRLRLYLYSFTDPQNPGSIRLERNAEYTLRPR